MPRQELLVDPDPSDGAMGAGIGVQRLLLRGECVEQGERGLAVDVGAGHERRRLLVQAATMTHQHQGCVIAAGYGRPEYAGDVAHHEVAFDDTVRRRFRGEAQRMHRLAPFGSAMVCGAPGDPYVNRLPATARGAPTCVQPSWVSPPRAVSRTRARYQSPAAP